MNPMPPPKFLPRLISDTRIIQDNYFVASIPHSYDTPWADFFTLTVFVQMFLLGQGDLLCSLNSKNLVRNTQYRQQVLVDSSSKEIREISEVICELPYE